jgi:hypothetical protein
VGLLASVGWLVGVGRLAAVVTVGVAAGVAEASAAALARAAVAAAVMPAAVMPAVAAAVVAGCAFAATVPVLGAAHAVMSVIAASVSAAAIIALARRRRLDRLRRPPCLLPNATERPPFASVPVDGDAGRHRQITEIAGKIFCYFARDSIKSTGRTRRAERMRRN